MGFGTGQIFTKQTGIMVSGHVKSMPFAECREEGGGWHCETRVVATVAYTVLPYWALALTRHWKYPRGRGCFHLRAFCSGGKWLWSGSSPENLAGSTLVYPLPRDPQSHFKSLVGLVLGLLRFRTLRGSLLGPKPVDEGASRLVLAVLGWASLGQ